MAAITNELGAVVERLAYDPWGKRRFVNTAPGQADPLDAIVGVRTDRGYTGHEHLDEMGVIHANGRIYDPLIGRFMSADPFIQAAGELQNYNRYSYVLNNPLGLTDPSGFFFKKFFKKFFRPILAIAVYYVTQGAVNPYLLLNGWSVTGAAFAAGAAGGAAGGLVATGNIKGTLQGAVSGAFFGGAGTIGSATDGIRYIAHFGAGCVSSVAGGGGCGAGGVPATVSKFTANQTGEWGAGVGQATATAVAGGVNSMVTGGNFWNGATTASFEYLFKSAPKVYKHVVGYELDMRPGGDAMEKGYEQMPEKGANNIGTQGDGLDPRCIFCEGGFLSRAANRIPGINAVAGMHDVMQVKSPGILRDIFNVPGMPIAAIVTYGAALGQALNVVPSPMYIYHLRKEDRR